MRRTEVVFLLCVFVFATIFVARSVTQTISLLPAGPPSAAAPTGAAGQPRDVDLPELKRLLDRGVLSNHEAEFYEPVGPPPDAGDKDQRGTDESAVPREADGLQKSPFLAQ
jgi:hypothetical protein